jgi:hypothetical protein
MGKYSNASMGNMELERALNSLSVGLNDIPVTTGNIYYVIPAADGGYVQFCKDHGRIYSDGTSNIYNTVKAAYDATTSNRHDVIIISANAAHTQTSMLTVVKNRVHFVGLGLRAGSIGLGARARIAMGATGVATDIAVMKNTGVGNTFRNLKFDSSSTTAESLYAVAEGGEFTIYEGCEFYKSTDLDVSLSAEVVNNGDSVQWINCTFGSLVNEIADNMVRPNMLLTPETVGSGKSCTDNIISNCLFLVNSAGVEAKRIYGASGSGADVVRMLLIKDSIFLSKLNASATPDSAIGFAAAQSAGTVLLTNCISVDHTVMKTASQNIYVCGAVPTQNTSGVSVTG